MRTFYFILWFIPTVCLSQPQNNHVLRLKSVNTITEMNTIANPSEGCFVYVNENQSIYFFNGTNWGLIGNPWYLNGNQCQGHHFLGTINNQDLSFKTNNIERMITKNNGNIGIKTNTPEARFQVGESGNFANDILMFNNTNSTVVSANYHFVYVDDDLSTNGVIYANQEIQYNGTASDPKIISGYSLRITNFNPLTAFTFMGRLNDGSPWINLDNQTNVSWPASYFLEFTFNNTTVYEDYKIVFNSINYTQTQASQLIEIEFIENTTSQATFAVEDNGNVGINKYPAAERLHVGGNIIADAFTPDYVFEH